MERENIRVQTMAGREQKAREGKWNGGFAPYGYRLENGELVIAEDAVCDGLERLRKRYPDQYLYIILDNAAYQHCRKVRDKTEK